MSSARYANRSDGLLRYKVTVSLWPSQIASMRAYYRQQRITCDCGLNAARATLEETRNPK